MNPPIRAARRAELSVDDPGCVLSRMHLKTPLRTLPPQDLRPKFADLSPIANPWAKKIVDMLPVQTIPQPVGHAAGRLIRVADAPVRREVHFDLSHIGVDVGKDARTFSRKTSNWAYNPIDAEVREAEAAAEKAESEKKDE